VVENRGEFPLSHLAVIADAVTSPTRLLYVLKIKPGDLVMRHRCHRGVGVYATQIARALGAKEVIGMGRNPAKLERALQFGATKVISTAGKDIKAIKDEFRALLQRKRSTIQLRVEDNGMDPVPAKVRISPSSCFPLSVYW